MEEGGTARGGVKTSIGRWEAEEANLTAHDHEVRDCPDRGTPISAAICHRDFPQMRFVPVTSRNVADVEFALEFGSLRACHEPRFHVPARSVIRRLMRILEARADIRPVTTRSDQNSSNVDPKLALE